MYLLPFSFLGLPFVSDHTLPSLSRPRLDSGSSASFGPRRGGKTARFLAPSSTDAPFYVLFCKMGVTIASHQTQEPLMGDQNVPLLPTLRPTLGPLAIMTTPSPHLISRSLPQVNMENHGSFFQG